jgi:hypothetical protein
MLARCSFWPWRTALADTERSYSCTSAVSDVIESGRASSASDAIDSGRASAELERRRDGTEASELRGLVTSSTAVVELADCERRRCCTATPGAGGGSGRMLDMLVAVLRRAKAEVAGMSLSRPRNIIAVRSSAGLGSPHLRVFVSHLELLQTRTKPARPPPPANAPFLLAARHGAGPIDFLHWNPRTLSDYERAPPERASLRPLQGPCEAAKLGSCVGSCGGAKRAVRAGVLKGPCMMISTRRVSSELERAFEERGGTGELVEPPSER